MKNKPHNFQLHKYPYLYDCTGKDHFFPIEEAPIPMNQAQEALIKDSYAVKSELPLFMVCHICLDGIMKPRGYHGDCSFTIPVDSDFIDMLLDDELETPAVY